jgi:hypothetical protein
VKQHSPREQRWVTTGTSECPHFGKELLKKPERYQKIMLLIKVQICRTESLVRSIHILALWGNTVLILFQDSYAQYFANELYSNISAEHGR